MVDNRDGKTSLRTGQVRNLCDRRFGVGADGVILIESHASADFFMNYYNSDGSQSFCGNGSRCAVDFYRELTGSVEPLTFEAIDGMHQAHTKGEGHHIAMRDCALPERLDGGYFLHTGSPHVVIYVDNTEEVNVLVAGRNIRYSERWKEEGTNVNFVSREGDALHVRTYERGVESETLSCGTGVTAVALIDGWLHGGEERRISTRGGTLLVRWTMEQETFTGIELAGPAQKVFTGVVDLGR